MFVQFKFVLSLFPCLQSWCKENFIHVRHMKIILDIRLQLVELCERLGVTLTSGGADCSQNLRKAMLRGLFVNVAEHAGEGKYRTVSDVWVKGRSVPYGIRRALRKGEIPNKHPPSLSTNLSFS